MILRRDAGLRLLSPALRYPGPPADGGRALRGAAGARARDGRGATTCRAEAPRKRLPECLGVSPDVLRRADSASTAQPAGLCVKRGQALAAKGASTASSG